MRRLPIFLLALVALVSPARAVANPCNRSSTPPVTYDHVVWIVMENHSLADLYGNPDAPYWNRLAARCGMPTNYHGITHPSAPNYIAMTSGDVGIVGNAWPYETPLTSASIFSQAGDWRELNESMPSNCNLGSTSLYLSLLNPATYYLPIRSACATRDVPLGASPDISARFTLIVPNMCNNTHNCAISVGDAWLRRTMRSIIRGSIYQAGRTAVFVVYDEDDYTSGILPTLVVAPTVRSGARPSVWFDHYSLLRTTEEMLGVPCLARACFASSMRLALGA